LGCFSACEVVSTQQSPQMSTGWPLPSSSLPLFRRDDRCQHRSSSSTSGWLPVSSIVSSTSWMRPVSERPLPPLVSERPLPALEREQLLGPRLSCDKCTGRRAEAAFELWERSIPGALDARRTGRGRGGLLSSSQLPDMHCVAPLPGKVAARCAGAAPKSAGAMLGSLEFEAQARCGLGSGGCSGGLLGCLECEARDCGGLGCELTSDAATSRMLSSKEDGWLVCSGGIAGRSLR